MAAPRPMLLAFYLTLVLLTTRRCLLFRIAVAKHCVSTLLSSIMSALIVGPIEYIHVFEVATVVTESVILLSLPEGLHAFVADVVLFSILQCSQFDLKEADWHISVDVRCTAKMRHLSGVSRMTTGVAMC